MSLGIANRTLEIAACSRQEAQLTEPSTETYILRCDQDHQVTLTLNGLQSLIEDGESTCERCGTEMRFDEPDSVTLECYVCQNVSEVSSLAEANGIGWEGCLYCQEKGGVSASPCLRGSWSYRSREYDWARESKSIRPIIRVGRTDYWKAVVHFCTAEQFAEIQQTRTIRAAKTGYYSTPAVCLTEVPHTNWDDMRQRHGEFGYVFTKDELLRIGGGPALYVSDRLIAAQNAHGGFADAVKPFLNAMRRPGVNSEKPLHDFLHEREWRVPGDINLGETVPFGVVRGTFDTTVKGWQNIWDALLEFQELGFDDSSTPDSEDEHAPPPKSSGSDPWI